MDKTLRRDAEYAHRALFDEIEKLEARIEELEDKLQELEEKLENAGGTIVDLQKENEELAGELQECRG